MELLLLLSPVAVTLLTGGIKKIISANWFKGDIKKVVLRLVVATLSLGVAVGNAILSGGDVPVASVETFVEAFFVFLSSTGIYFFSKKK